MSFPTSVCRFRQSLVVSDKRLSFPTKRLSFPTNALSENRELRNVIIVMMEFRPLVLASRGEMTKKSCSRHTHAGIKYLVVPLARGHTPKIHFVQTCLYQKGFWNKCTGVVYCMLKRFYEICHIVPAHGRKGAHLPLFHVKRYSFSVKCSKRVDQSFGKNANSK